jgi:hypothetical protein
MVALIGLAGPLLLLPVRAAAPPVPNHAVSLLEDNADALIAQLTNEGLADTSVARREERDCYSGACAIRVTPLQRFRAYVPGWQYRIVERPAAGEYRYVRFAWKKVGGQGIMVQFHDGQRGWGQRYLAGVPSAMASWAAVEVAEKAPLNWEIVTRDLYADFGAMTLTGMALTAMDGTAGLFDHIYLGRTSADLDRASAAALGKVAPTEALSRPRLDKLWADLGSRDGARVGRAMRALTAGHKQSVPFLAERLKALAPDAKRIARLIAELDDDDFEVRETASRELEKLGTTVLPTLRQTVKKTSSVEVRKRATSLVQKLALEAGTLTPDQLRLARAIRVLVHAGTPSARELLRSLAAAPQQAGLDEDARAALGRAVKRP